LKWWDTATTCPICRAEIFDADADEAEEAAAAAAVAAGEAAGEVAGEVEGEESVNDNEMNEGLWMRREFWNGRIDHLIETDDEEDGHGGIERNVISRDAADAADAAAHESEEAPHRMNPITRIDRYLHQDTDLNWHTHQSPDLGDMAHQMTNRPLSEAEIQGLRENRVIAMTLFARMRFRETLFESSTLFMGRVWDGVFVQKNEWIDIMHYMWYPLSSESIMYEFVIRRNSAISPLYEVNIFGFIKDVMIQRTVDYNADADADDDWEESHEYVFIADVFTSTDFYIHNEWGNPANALRSYGRYHMEEGTITPQELIIPFSQVRRLYIINGHEHSDI